MPPVASPRLTFAPYAGPLRLGVPLAAGFQYPFDPEIHSASSPTKRCILRAGEPPEGFALLPEFPVCAVPAVPQQPPQAILEFHRPPEIVFEALPVRCCIPDIAGRPSTFELSPVAAFCFPPAVPDAQWQVTCLLRPRRDTPSATRTEKKYIHRTHAMPAGFLLASCVAVCIGLLRPHGDPAVGRRSPGYSGTPSLARPAATGIPRNGVPPAGSSPCPAFAFSLLLPGPPALFVAVATHPLLPDTASAIPSEAVCTP